MDKGGKGKQVEVGVIRSGKTKEKNITEGRRRREGELSSRGDKKQEVVVTEKNEGERQGKRRKQKVGVTSLLIILVLYSSIGHVVYMLLGSHTLHVYANSHNKRKTIHNIA